MNSATSASSPGPPGIAINFITRSKARLRFGSAGEETGADAVGFRRCAMGSYAVGSYAVGVLV